MLYAQVYLFFSLHRRIRSFWRLLLLYYLQANKLACHSVMNDSRLLRLLGQIQRTVY